MIDDHPHRDICRMLLQLVSDLHRNVVAVEDADIDIDAPGSFGQAVSEDRIKALSIDQQPQRPAFARGAGMRIEPLLPGDEVHAWSGSQGGNFRPFVAQARTEYAG